MRRFRTLCLPARRRPQHPAQRAVLAAAFELLIARRLADPTQPAPGPDYPAPIPF